MNLLFFVPLFSSGKETPSNYAHSQPAGAAHDLHRMWKVVSVRISRRCLCRWIADDLGIPSFAKLAELTVVPVEQFDQRFGIWTIECGLSPGCGGPPLPEEIIL